MKHQHDLTHDPTLNPAVPASRLLEQCATVSQRNKRAQRLICVQSPIEHTKPLDQTLPQPKPPNCKLSGELSSRQV